ncbi:MAG: transcriptional regulator [Desulfobacterales bacterium]|nr:transcriptional regulator [Desulfobacterales bacterium]
MKMFLMVYDTDFDEDVIATLKACRVTGYTKWDRVLGRGKKSDPKLDDAVWPGFNRAIAVVVEDEVEDELFNEMEKLSKKPGGTGFKVFELPVLRVI